MESISSKGHFILQQTWCPSSCYGVPFGRSRRFVQNQTNDGHLRREVYIGVIDKISQELDSRFDENMELLFCMSALNPSNSFASFDAQKVR